MVALLYCLDLVGEELYDFEGFFGVVGSGCDRGEVNKSGFKSGFILRQVKMGLDGKKDGYPRLGAACEKVVAG